MIIYGVSGSEGGSDNHGLLYARNDRDRAAEESEGNSTISLIPSTPVKSFSIEDWYLRMPASLSSPYPAGIVCSEGDTSSHHVIGEDAGSYGPVHSLFTSAIHPENFRNSCDSLGIHFDLPLNVCCSCIEEGAEEFIVKPVKLSDVKRLRNYTNRGTRVRCQGSHTRQISQKVAIWPPDPSHPASAGACS